MKRQHNQTTSFLMLLLLRLQSGKTRTSGGYTLVITIAVLLVLSVLLITYAITSKVDSVSSTASAKSNTGFYNAEAGLNRRAEAIRAAFVGYKRPLGMPPKDISGQTTWKACIQPGGYIGTGDFQCDTDANIGVQPVTTYVEDLTLNVPASIVIPPGELFGGFSAQEYRYNVISVAQDKQQQPTAILGMQFKSRLIPLFQFAIFYNQALDFSIPPDMTVNGPIHSNSDLYLDASSGDTLSVQGKVTTAGSFYRGARIAYGSTCSGTVKVLANTLACGGGGLRQYTQPDLNTLNNTDIRVGIRPLIVPPLNRFDAEPGPDNEYWNKADLRIVLKLDSSEKPASIEVQAVDTSPDATATNRLLGDVCAPPLTTISGAALTTDTQLLVTPHSISSTPQNGPALQIEPSGTTDYLSNSATIDNDANVVKATAPTSLDLSKQVGLNPAGQPPIANSVVRKAAVWTSDTFWNYREKNSPSSPTPPDAKQIRMLNVDMQALMTCANQLMGTKNLDDATEGGLVWFLTVKGPNSKNDVALGNPSNTYGVRVYNGAELKSANVSDPAIKGLTIVSDQAVYVSGDYNAVNKKPAAVMADTINVLSNAWRLDDADSRTYNAGDQQTGGPVDMTSGERTASTTTINAAFLSGIDLTGGGVNNYPRFQENWKNIPMNYRGSMVSLGLPRRVNSPFCGSGSTNVNCNIYNPPFRNWDYDAAFNNAANLPPITPRVVYLKQDIFSRSFDQASRPMPVLWAKLWPSHWLGALTTLIQTTR